jgi:P27 family predicted phage terminase small subunit
LKVLKGARKDRINDDEPNQLPGRPDPPHYLDKEGLREWNRILPELEECGVLSRADGAALGLYCSSFSAMVAAEKEVQAMGLFVETDKGSLKANPAVAMARNARCVCARLLVEFGLTPSSRTRLKVPSVDGSKDDIDGFIASRPA